MIFGIVVLAFFLQMVRTYWPSRKYCVTSNWQLRLAILIKSVKRKLRHWKKWVNSCGTRWSNRMRHKELVEKLVELRPYRGGLKITAGKRKNPKPLENKGFWDLVPVTGLEPVRCRQRWILSPLRLPFHHTGRFIPACIQWEIDRLRCPISSSTFKSLRQLSTAAHRSGRFFRHRRRSHRSPSHR